MKWSKGWEPRFRLHIGFFHSLLGRRLMVAQRENKGRLTPRCSRLASALLRRAAERNRYVSTINGCYNRQLSETAYFFGSQKVSLKTPVSSAIVDISYHLH